MHRKQDPLIRLAVLAALALAALAGALPVRAEEPPTESWYAMTIGGTVVGYLQTRAESATGGGYVETTEMRVALNRLGNRVEIGMTATVEESARGELLRVAAETRTSSQATRLTATLDGESARIEQAAGEAVSARSVPLARAPLGPEGIRRLCRERLAAPGDTIAYDTLPPDLGTVTGITRTVVAVEIAPGGERLLRVTERMSAAPLVSTLWLDADCETTRAETPGPFGVVALVRTDAATAQLGAAGGELPDESYRATLAPTQVRLPEPRRAERLVLELRHRNPTLGWPDLEAPGQRVLERSEDRLVLETARRHPVTAVALPIAPTEEMAPYLAANAWVQSDAPAARQLARSIVGDETDVFRAAQHLERWVAENVTFDLGVVLAPSSEVLENRKGTCTEYAMLLTTLTRAVGIPSRFVMGYVYVGGIFGGHAWTEIRVGDQWVALDGAVPASGPADAARFAFTWTSLAEGVGELSIGPGVQLYGQIDLAVLEYETSDRLWSFATDAPLYSVTGGTYRNEPLGLELALPEGYRFTALDERWPSATLVAFEGPGDASGELAEVPLRPWQALEPQLRAAAERAAPTGAVERVEVGGLEGWRAVADGRAALVVRRGSEAWRLSVVGERAADRLEGLGASLAFRP